MKHATATVLYVMLASASLASAFPSLWSSYYRDALNSARLQQQAPQCQLEQSPASIRCQSARLTTGGRNSFVHVCPVSGSPQEVCYNSKLARCCRSDVERGLLKCVSATKLSIGSHEVTVGIYEAAGTPGYCIYFQSAVDVPSCCPGAGEELQCRQEPPPKPTPPPCVPKRDIYFVLDTTESIGSEIFCRFGYVIQLIEAAINPSGGLDGARVATVLFENQLTPLIRYVPAYLFNLNDRCSDGVNSKIPRIVYEYRGVETKELSHTVESSLIYPNVGARSTLPNSAIAVVRRRIDAEGTSRPASVIILTDGKPQQTVSEISRLRKSAAVIIAAGIGSPTDIDQSVLESLASTPADAVYESDTRNVISFAKRIVERMRDTAALCLDQAQSILNTLDKATVDDLNTYCSSCMFTQTPSDSCKANKFPQCGARNLQMQAFDDEFESAKVEDKSFSDWQKLILEEKILAEVEKIVEMGEERKQQQVEEESVVLPVV